ncbi:hypothetical protein GCM10022252_76500 [Streptosporangium oxazolinicum]|uniref:HTH cro/C1-type domain-containing protein n=1 Tax=Streptosporangium oxazolinicum TaxID=909287 RepID=A0ABP8BL94_9ACTN
MSLSARLTFLFQHVLNPADGKPFSIREVSAAITAAGEPITAAYLSLISTGSRTTVSLEKALGIAQFFGVPVQYLRAGADEAQMAYVARLEAQLVLLADAVRAGQIPERLRHLFATLKNLETGQPYSPGEASAAIAAAGTPITEQALAELVSGERRWALLNEVTGIARLFGVPVEYLIGDEEIRERVESQLALLTAMKDQQIQQIALRAAGLDDSARRRIAHVIEREHGERPNQA